MTTKTPVAVSQPLPICSVCPRDTQNSWLSLSMPRVPWNVPLLCAVPHASPLTFDIARKSERVRSGHITSQVQYPERLTNKWQLRCKGSKALGALVEKAAELLESFYIAV